MDEVCSEHELPIEVGECPFQVEINGDHDDCDICCEDCRDECAQDI